MKPIRESARLDWDGEGMGIVKTKTRQIVYLRVIKGEDCIVAGSLKPVVWSDEIAPDEEDTNEYETLVTEVPRALAKKLDAHSEWGESFSDGYEAYKKTAKYLKGVKPI